MMDLCRCGKPASHVDADPDSSEWACQVQPAVVGVEITDEAVDEDLSSVVHWDPSESCPEFGREQMREAYRAGYEAAARPFMTSRPALDREAVKLALLETWNDMAWDETPFDPMQQIDQFTDAATALAVPVPTEEELVEAISARLHITTDLIADGGKPRHLSADTSAVVEAARAVLALLNGSAKPAER